MCLTRLLLWGFVRSHAHAWNLDNSSWVLLQRKEVDGQAKTITRLLYDFFATGEFKVYSRVHRHLDLVRQGLWEWSGLLSAYTLTPIFPLNTSSCEAAWLEGPTLRIARAATGGCTHAIGSHAWNNVIGTATGVRLGGPFMRGAVEDLSCRSLLLDGDSAQWQVEEWAAWQRRLSWQVASNKSSMGSYPPPRRSDAGCYLGFLTRSLLLGKIDRSAALLSAQTPPWSYILSSWPLFVVAEDRSKGVRFTKDMCGSVEIAALKKLAAGVANIQRGWQHSLVRPSEQQRRLLEQRPVIFRQVTEVEVALRSCGATWSLDASLAAAMGPLGMLQRSLYVGGSCPPFGFAVLSALGFRLCIRKKHLMAAPLDFNTLKYGTWHDCHTLDKVLPRHRPRCAVLEVGANIGFCSLHYAAAGRRAIAIEPMPDNVALLKGSLGLLQDFPMEPFLAVRVIEAAAVSSPGPVKLYLDSENVAGNSLHQEADGGVPGAQAGNSRMGSHINVSGVRIDDLGLQDVCGVLVDSEGHEQDVLLGMRKLLTPIEDGGVEAVALEWSPNIMRLIGQDHGGLVLFHTVHRNFGPDGSPPGPILDAFLDAFQ